VDLFEPGSGLTVQVHDYQPGIAPSGLFWTVPMSDAAFQRTGLVARYAVTDLPVLDSFQIFGPDEVPGLVTFDMTFEASGPMRHLRPGSTDPADPTAFAAELRDAATTGTFSGSSVTELGGDPFSFSGTATGIWGELGKERNGFYLTGRAAPPAMNP
jgi:hypothetical protein